MSNIHKEVSPLPPKVYGNHRLLNNTKSTYLKGESECMFQFYPTQLCENTVQWGHF